MLMGGFRVLVRVLAMFVGRLGVFLRLFVFANIMMMSRLMVMMRGGVVMGGGLMMVLARRMLRLCHDFSLDWIPQTDPGCDLAMDGMC